MEGVPAWRRAAPAANGMTGRRYYVPVGLVWVNSIVERYSPRCPRLDRRECGNRGPDWAFDSTGLRRSLNLFGAWMPKSLPRMERIGALMH